MESNPTLIDSTSNKCHQCLLVQRLSDSAILPVRQTPDSAGYDLFAAKNMIICSRSKELVPTDLAIQVPKGTYGRIAPRSGIALKFFIDVGAGVIDADYRGPVGVLLFNHGHDDFYIKKGDRIAQLILELIYQTDVVEVNNLSSTVRGKGGFGSTGV